MATATEVQGYAAVPLNVDVVRGATARTATFNLYGPFSAVAAVGTTVTNKALTSNVATITTSTAHNLVVGDVVIVAGVDATFNGTFVVATVPTGTTFTYAKTAGNVTSTASGGSVTASTKELNKINKVVLTPDLSVPGTTVTGTVDATAATNGKVALPFTYQAGDAYKQFSIVVEYHVTDTTEAQKAGQNFVTGDVISQSPAAGSVTINTPVTLVRVKKATIVGSIYPNKSDNDWNVKDTYPADLPFGVLLGVDPSTTPTAGVQQAVGISGSLANSAKSALVPGDRIEVDQPSTTPTTGAGFVPAFGKAWYKDEYITLVPTIYGISQGRSPAPYYWNGSAWVSGTNSGGSNPAKIASATVVTGGATSSVQDSAGSTITVSGMTLAQLRRLGGLTNAKKWPNTAYITITADATVTPNTSNKAYWDGQKWADGTAGSDATFVRNPYDGYLG